MMIIHCVDYMMEIDKQYWFVIANLSILYSLKNQKIIKDLILTTKQLNENMAKLFRSNSLFLYRILLN